MRGARLVVVVLAATLAGGCQSQLSRIKADNARLAEQLAELRAEKRKRERAHRDEVGVRARAEADAGPVLPVEVLEPAAPIEYATTFGAAGDSEEYGDDGLRVVGVTEDGTEIVYAGDAAAGRVGTWDGEVGDDLGELAPDDLDVPEPDDAPPPPKAKPGKGSAEAAYRAAVALLHERRHADAIEALREFLRTHPHHEHADNAQYWLGEAFYDQRDYGQAALEFRAVVDGYPDGNKVPDALLKLGYTELALDQRDQGRATLERLVHDHPDTEPARLAQARLETITP